MTLINISIKGGPGSGNWGHRGVPGKVGGSSPRGAGTSKYAFIRSGEPGKLGTSSNTVEAMFNSEAGKSTPMAWKSMDVESKVRLKGDIVSNLSNSTGIAQEDVNNIIGEWAETSNDMSRQAISMQEAVSEEFGVPLSDWQESNHIRSRGFVPREDERKLLRNMYTSTQAKLKSAGFKRGNRITVYRGMGVSGSSPKHNKGDVINYNGNAMESWSIDYNTAMSFSSNVMAGKIGLVLSMSVPIENIVSTALTGLGCVTESEIIVLGSLPGNVASIA